MSATRKTIQRNRSAKRRLFTYSEASLQESLRSIRSGELSIREASRKYGVPRATIQDRLHGRSIDSLKKTGPEPIMTIEGEKRIAQWIIDIAKCGFPITKEVLIDTVTKIARDSGTLGKFANDRPGIRWYKNFLKRHPEISVREAESINKTRALVTEESVRLWFRNLTSFLENINCIDIMEDPTRIFNADESGFTLCPKTGKVLAPRGWKNLYQIKSGSGKEQITVLIVVSANGEICPPLVVFPYIRPPKALVNNMPDNWILAKSETGWMRSDVFFEFVCNDFNKWLDTNNIKKPIILFIDGHKSHMTLPLSKFCEEHGIVLYALPPNCTHIIQPADVSVFRPLKHEWKKTIRKWQSKPENTNAVVNKFNFCSVFQETLMTANMVDSIKNGFRRCGLFPLDPNNVDYTKCVKNTLEKQIHKENSNRVSLSSKDFRSTEKVIKAIETQLYNYGINVEVVLNEIKYLENKSNLGIKQTSHTNDLNSFENQNSNTNVLVEVTDNEPRINIGSVLPINDINVLPVFILDQQGIPNLQIESNRLQSPLEPRCDNEEEIPAAEGIPQPESNLLLEDFSRNDGANDNFNPEKDDSEQQTLLSHRPESPLEPQSDKERRSAVEGIVEDHSNLVLEDLSQNDGANDNCNRDKDDSEQSEQSVLPPIHTTPDKLSSSQKTANEETSQTSPTTPFSRHLSFPTPVDQSQRSKTKEKLPSAISCKEWRRYYEKKEEEKQKKLEGVRKRKELKELNQNTAAQTKKRKKVSAKKKIDTQSKENDTNSNEDKERISCFFCEDDLYSEAEEDSEKNIGCDYCTRWYHLRCTEFAEFPYEDVANRDYRCEMCCCDVISDMDVDTIKIMSEVCSTIIKKEAEEDGVPLTGREIIARCRSAVLETCGIDISAVLQQQVRLGHTTKQILDQVRSMNGSLCLKYNFGVAPWKLGVPHAIRVAPTSSVRQERPTHLRSEMVHPAFKERGRAIPQTTTSPPSRFVAAKRVVEGRVRCIIIITKNHYLTSY
ncbi:unnamed protein product, partial [Callosobruchus maculatus]